MTSFKEAKIASDVYLSQFQDILQDVLCEKLSLGTIVSIATEYDDLKLNTDMVIHTDRGDLYKRISLRVRNYLHYIRNVREITIRTKSRNGGTRTEIDKILDRWGDYMIYAHKSSDNTTLIRYIIIDLVLFRLYYLMLVATNTLPETKTNSDSSQFMQFSIAAMYQFNKDIVLHCSPAYDEYMEDYEEPTVTNTVYIKGVPCTFTVRAKPVVSFKKRL